MRTQEEGRTLFTVACGQGHENGDEFDACVVFVAILTNSLRGEDDADAVVLGDMVVHLRVAGGCDDD